MKTALLLFSLCFVGIYGLPTNFDARQQWSHCPWIILEQACGDCWAFCSAEAFSNRICIKGQGTPLISPEPLTECAARGCDGGTAQTAWNFFKSTGGTTCTNQCTGGCAPYDTAKTGTAPKCHAGTCDTGKPWAQTYYAAKQKNLDADSIQNELYTNGPLQTMFSVHDNFSPFFDKHPTGIYTTTAGSGVVGNHCVKMIGWGVENGQAYWLFANSWGANFADKGYFKMARGINLCGIEGGTNAGIVANGNPVNAGIPELYEEEEEEVPSNTTADIIGGGWMTQDNTINPFFIEVAEAGLAAVQEKLEREFTLKSIESMETQVVAGINFRLEVSTEEGFTVEMKVLQDIKLNYVLVDFKI